MSAANIARLQNRGVVSVTGQDSEKLLQGLVTNDIECLAKGEARHAGLLSPQGKILFDFFVVKHGAGYLLVIARTKAAELVKRLTMYKLRADVALADVSDAFEVSAVWGADADVSGEGNVVAFRDPRHPSMGLVLLSNAAVEERRAEAADDSVNDYDAHRVELGVPEGGKDYEFGDAYPHEANFDLLHGVSFSKGCYVGQEIVARMQNKTVVRKRAVKISGDAPLTSGSDILLGDIPVGRIGTIAGNRALAMLRLDRAVEAEQKNLPLTADGILVTADHEAIDRYRASAARVQTILP
ncbi:folate-binding protein [Hyphomicrobium sp.]|uniref:CAF17-like 4Fe-4S cluster assembly/insertion protein YgfZ n=1 Tax=Hyphomicrobium sp. TaxID=82 RepID=UPI000FB61989|nr:folate-binding protein [Hyphomicrobium sp.]RUO97708.1 MAG: folate-binding protein [Hyphomicrobium sp.]